MTRQVPYEPGSTKTLDLALFVNGIPVATAELKNPLTGQTVEHAIAQYRDRSGPRRRRCCGGRWCTSRWTPSRCS